MKLKSLLGSSTNLKEKMSALFILLFSALAYFNYIESDKSDYCENNPDCSQGKCIEVGLPDFTICLEKDIYPNISLGRALGSKDISSISVSYSEVGYKYFKTCRVDCISVDLYIKGDSYSNTGLVLSNWFDNDVETEMITDYRNKTGFLDVSEYLSSFDNEEVYIYFNNGVGEAHFFITKDPEHGSYGDVKVYNILGDRVAVSFGKYYEIKYTNEFILKDILRIINNIEINILENLVEKGNEKN